MKKANLVFVLPAVLILACGIFEGAKQTPTSPSQAVIPTAMDVPAATNAPATTTSAELETLDTIPGLSPADVTESLEELGLSCDDETRELDLLNGRIIYVTTCMKDEPTKYHYEVGILAREISKVDYIRTTVSEYDAPNANYEIALPVIEGTATLPYTGATPNEAREWVESVLRAMSVDTGTLEEKVFAGISYKISGYLGFATLEMGKSPVVAP
jgi:hypothetical protein